MGEPEMKTERFQLMAPPGWIGRVDDWSFTNRVRARAEAIRQLVERGLRAFAEDARNENADGAASGKQTPSTFHPAAGGPEHVR